MQPQCRMFPEFGYLRYHAERSKHIVRWWRQNLSVVRQCLTTDRGLYVCVRLPCGLTYYTFFDWKTVINLHFFFTVDRAVWDKLTLLYRGPSGLLLVTGRTPEDASLFSSCLNVYWFSLNNFLFYFIHIFRTLLFSIFHPFFLAQVHDGGALAMPCFRWIKTSFFLHWCCTCNLAATLVTRAVFNFCCRCRGIYNEHIVTVYLYCSVRVCVCVRACSCACVTERERVGRDGEKNLIFRINHGGYSSARALEKENWR